MKAPMWVIFVIFGYLITTKATKSKQTGNTGGGKLSAGLKLKGEAAFIEVIKRSV